MKYVCKICGFIYDEASQQTPFLNLPETWHCPICQASKANFLVQQNEAVDTIKDREFINVENWNELTVVQLSALCYNLAKGCEKQYKFPQQQLFIELGKYFDTITPRVLENSIEDIRKLIDWDLSSGYQKARTLANNANDRGALRVCTWGEKVTIILKDLLERFTSNNEETFEGEEIWVCSICGFVYVGDTAPVLCPVCKVPDWKFKKIEGGTI